MPKIVINEYDLTKAGTSEYSNFSVVVPGYLADDKYMEVVDEAGNKSLKLIPEVEAVFDENGIYECSSQADFVKFVGKKANEVVVRKVEGEAVAAKVSYVIRLDESLVNDYAKTESAGAPIEYSFKTKKGFNEAMAKIAEGKHPVNADETLAASLAVYYATPNLTGEVGSLKDNKYQYVAASEFTTSDGTEHTVTVDPTSGTLIINNVPVADLDVYYLIDSADQGVDGIYTESRVTHYGNQMAYELLGLGYTVLYKKLHSVHEDELEAEVVNGADMPYKGNGYTYHKAKEEVLTQLNDLSFWECLKDKSTYDFRYVVTGLMTGNELANKCILALCDHSQEVSLDDASIADGRGDCIALIDLDCDTYEGATQSEAVKKLAEEAAKYPSTYCAVFAPYVTYVMAEDAAYNNNRTFPASFHYLACAANSSANNYNEWYANAGYTRGVSAYTIESTGCKFGEIAIQALEPRFTLKVGTKLDETGTKNLDVNTTVAVNLIVKIKSSYYLWGNRTAKKLGTRYASDGDLVAHHFLNIRQLCTTIKKQVYVTCRRLTFDPNSNVLWINFRSLLTPMLEKMKADQGIRDYAFVKNATDRKALLSAKIRIVPIEAVEDFEIGLYLEDSLSEVAVTE